MPAIGQIDSARAGPIPRQLVEWSGARSRPLDGCGLRIAVTACKQEHRHGQNGHAKLLACGSRMYGHRQVPRVIPRPNNTPTGPWFPEVIEADDVGDWHLATRGLSFQTSAFGSKADMAAPRIDVA